MSKKDHWEEIYENKRTTDVSWFAPHLTASLELIDSAKLNSGAAIIDVGGGASTLVDDLLARGFTNITVLDISAAALEKTKERLGEHAAGVS